MSAPCTRCGCPIYAAQAEHAPICLACYAFEECERLRRQVATIARDTLLEAAQVARAEEARFEARSETRERAHARMVTAGRIAHQLEQRAKRFQPEPQEGGER